MGTYMKRNERLNMACKNCVYFKKLRSLSFGECSNDKAFQYAESKEDLKDLGDHVLVIMGEGEPIVGVNFACQNFLHRRSQQKEALSATEDSLGHPSGFTPPAQKKRRNQRPDNPWRYKSVDPLAGSDLDVDIPTDAQAYNEGAPMPEGAVFKTASGRTRVPYYGSVDPYPNIKPPKR
jgi:hypothetical protein